MQPKIFCVYFTWKGGKEARWYLKECDDYNILRKSGWTKAMWFMLKGWVSVFSVQHPHSPLQVSCSFLKSSVTNMLLRWQAVRSAKKGPLSTQLSAQSLTYSIHTHCWNRREQKDSKKKPWAGIMSQCSVSGSSLAHLAPSVLTSTELWSTPRPNL